MRVAAIPVRPAASRRPRWREFVELTKPRVVALMVFTVLVGMLLAAARSELAWDKVLFGTLGITLVAAGAAAVNHLVDRHIDARMARTRARPLPRGVLGAQQVGWFAMLLSTAGIGLLLIFTNPLCAWLTFASLVGYAIVYSMFLKHATPQNIVIGGAAGAAPPLLGWVAITGQVDAGAWLLFLIIFVWTPPHFWALAIHRRDDYARAGVPMLPVTHGVAHTTDRIFAYSIALLLVSLMPVAIGMSGWVYLASAAFLGIRFSVLAWRLRRDHHLAMPTFHFSIVYLTGLFVALLADRFVGASL